MTTTTPLVARAVQALREVRRDFARAGDAFPHIRHRLVEAPAARSPEFADLPPVCSSHIPGFNYFRLRVEDQPQTRGHHYSGLVDPDGADLETLDRLAGVAHEILAGCPRPTSMLVEALEALYRDRRGRATEGLMTAVHRLAWWGVAGQPLRATPSLPAAVGGRSAGSIDVGIPPDCRSSDLPDVSLFLACAWALDMIVEDLGGAGSSAAVANTQCKKTKKKLTDAEREDIVHEYMKIHPNAGVRDVQEKTGISTGKISTLRSWQAALERKRNAARTGLEQVVAHNSMPDRPAKRGPDDPQSAYAESEALLLEILEIAEPDRAAQYKKMISKKKRAILDNYRLLGHPAPVPDFFILFREQKKTGLERVILPQSLD